MVLVCAGAAARAETIQVPVGGTAVPIGKDRVVCGAPPEGWSAEQGGKVIRPPASASDTARAATVAIADDAKACDRATTTLTVVATARWPEIDLASVTFYRDEGRIEYKGQHLEQSQVLWQVDKRHGQESCLAPALGGKSSRWIATCPPT